MSEDLAQIHTGLTKEAGDSLIRVDFFSPEENIDSARQLIEKAFGAGPDANIGEWFSFEEMAKAIEAGRGACLQAKDEKGIIRGLLYAQPESPINGREGMDKWVVVMAAVDPDYSGKGIGQNLLTDMESHAAQKGATKMFVYTNEDDERVINFYRQNGYEDAGRIKDYQYGSGNSAAFLLKYLA
jgi:ribosomal protein S18 acetylase RimI-like enzyme